MSGWVMGESSRVKLEAEVLVMRMDLAVRRVAGRVLALRCWSSEKVKRCRIMWYRKVRRSMSRLRDPSRSPCGIKRVTLMRERWESKFGKVKG